MRRPPTPQKAGDKVNFGYVLWLILGGKEAKNSQAAKQLNIAAPALSNIIHGKSVSQDILAKRKWREILSTNYPGNWQMYSDLFEQCAAAMPRRAYLVKEPENKDSFAHVLWRILGGEGANLTEAARRLKIDRSSLTHILRGRRQGQVSKKTLKKRKWEKILADYYPEGWQKYSVAFERYASLLPKSTGCLISEPKDKNGFAHVLWLILGKEEIILTAAAQRLKMDIPTLSAIFRGHRKISRRTLLEKKWPKLLAKHYPEGWQQYSAAFDRCVATLRGSAGILTREPDDKGSFGHVLWLLLGGKKTEIVEAAPQLNMTASKLSAIIHGKMTISQQLVANKYWREVLAACHPDAWKQHAATFEQRVFALYSTTNTSTIKSEDDGSFGHVLWLILGGRKANFSKAAEQLKIDLPVLIATIHGRRRFSQRMLVNKKWRNILAEHYSENWNQHVTAFEQRAKGLPKSIPRQN